MNIYNCIVQSWLTIGQNLQNFIFFYQICLSFLNGRSTKCLRLPYDCSSIPHIFLLKQKSPSVHIEVTYNLFVVLCINGCNRYCFVKEPIDRTKYTCDGLRGYAHVAMCNFPDSKLLIVDHFVFLSGHCILSCITKLYISKI